MEILPFGYRATFAHIESLGYAPVLRKTAEGNAFVTDNGNYICDIHFSDVLQTPEKEQERLEQVPGILETGFFFHLAKKVIVGYDDGHAEIKE